MKYRLTRDVTAEECHWLDKDQVYRVGTEVYRYVGHTYGCISSTGVACSETEDIPFFELPRNALEPVE